MAALSQTAASVLPSANANLASGIAGATIVQGNMVYADSTDSYKIKLTTTATAAAANPVGMAINAASSGQRIDYVILDPALNIGATMLVGDDVWLFDTTPGAVTSTKADLEAGDYVTHIGVAITTTTINFKICAGGLIA